MIALTFTPFLMMVLPMIGASTPFLPLLLAGVQ
jgi:hypothetical protein